MEKIELNTLAFLHLLAASTPFAHLSNFVFLFKSQLSYILWNITWLTLSWVRYKRTIPTQHCAVDLQVHHHFNHSWGTYRCPCLISREL